MVLLDKKGLTEEQYIENFKKKNYPKPALTADILIFADNRTKLMLIKRGGHPFIGKWAFPGGFANENEIIETTAARELEEETSVTDIPLIPLGLITKPGRDPRGWTVSMAYTADVDMASCKPIAGDDAADTVWFHVSHTPGHVELSSDSVSIVFDYTVENNRADIVWKSEEQLAFDHAEILVKALLG